MIDGKQLAAAWMAELERDLKAIEVSSVRLAIILVGHDPSSVLYVEKKRRLFEDVGIGVDLISGDHLNDERVVIDMIRQLNADDQVVGILVQLPLPVKWNVQAVLSTIDPSKDVDGLTPIQQGGLVMSADMPVVPATPRGILRLMFHENVDIQGSRVVIVNDSFLVGRPLAMMLLSLGATVTICNRHTIDLSTLVAGADVVVLATGVHGVIAPDCLQGVGMVVDVGINYVDGCLVGDVACEQARHYCRSITPVPGGVGPMTVVALLANFYQLLTTN